MPWWWYASFPIVVILILGCRAVREYAFLSRRHLPRGIGCHTVAQTQPPKLDPAKKHQNWTQPEKKRQNRPWLQKTVWLRIR